MIFTTNASNIRQPLSLRGTIALAADFPDPLLVRAGWMYWVTANVTDNDPTKTNTGMSFLAGEEIAWNGSTWLELGSTVLWVRLGGKLSQFNTGDVITSYENALASTSTDGFLAENTTAALIGAKIQMSPAFHLSGKVWDESGAGISKDVSLRTELLPVNNTGAIGSAIYKWKYSYGGGAYSDLMYLNSDGCLENFGKIRGNKNSTDANGYTFDIYKSRASYGTPAAVVTGDNVYTQNFWLHDGTNYLNMAGIEVEAAGTIAATQTPTNMLFKVATNTTPSVKSTAMKLWYNLRAQFYGEIHSSTNTQIVGMWDDLQATYQTKLILWNSQTATAGVPNQYPPTLNFLGHVFNTTTSLDETQEWRMGMRTVSDTTPSSLFYLRVSKNGGAYSEPFSINSSGTLTITNALSMSDNAIIGNVNNAKGYISNGSATSGMNINRNLNDAYPACTTNNINAGANVVNIHEFKWQSILRACVSKEGNWLNYANSDDTTSRSLAFYKSRTSYAAPSTIVTGDKLGSLNFYGFDGTNYLDMAGIEVVSTGTILGTRVPTQINFYTATDATPSVKTLRMSILKTGVLDAPFGINCDAGSAITTIRNTGISITSNNIITTPTDGFAIQNATAATVGVPVQMSPRTRYRGTAWETTGGTSQTIDCTTELLPVTGATASGQYRVGFSINGAAYTYPMTLTSGGALTLLGSLSVPAGGTLQNVTNSGNGYFMPGWASSGNVIYRNVSDAFATVSINNAHATSTGNIAEFKWQSILRACVSKEGNWLNYANSTDAVGRSNASYKSRGTLASKLICVSGDVAANYSAWHYDGANDLETSRIVQTSYSTAIAATQIGGVVEIWLRPDTAGGVIAKQFNMLPNGFTGIHAAAQNSVALTVGFNNDTMLTGTTAARQFQTGGNITELNGAAITDIVGAYFNTFTVTDGGGAETVGFLATAYIAGAPTAGTAPTIGTYSLFVDAGEVRIDGDIGDTTNRIATLYSTSINNSGDIEITTETNGIILRDITLDTRHRITLDNGVLVVSAAL